MCRFKRFTVEAQRTASAAKGLIIVFALLSALTPQFACAQGNGRGNGRGNGNSFQQHGKGSQASENQGNRLSGARGYNSIGGNLTPAQVDQLVRMREEEKLAHDVYVTLAQSSGLQIFNNIANAESQHMRAVEQLASRYSSTVSSIRTTNEDREWGKEVRKVCTKEVAKQTRTINKWLLGRKKAMVNEVQDVSRSALISQ